MKTQFTQNELDEMRKNPNNYKWGIFYFNSKDPRFFVPKRNIVMGWTLNFANTYLYLIVFLIIVVIAVSLESKFFVRHETQQGESPLVPAPTTESELGDLSTQRYVYDDKLNYGFEYPDNSWEVVVNISKDVEQCDPTLNYETYTCVDFPYKNIKKVINFTKKQDRNLELPALQVNFTIKSAADLQEVTSEFKKEAVASNMSILNESAVTVNSISGYDILAGTPDWKLRQVAFFANGMAYVFRYSSQEKPYRLNEETFNSIVSSFSIKNETSVDKSATENTTTNQIANPASVNCIEKGGEHSIVDKPEGQIGMCALSDGTVCEEWAYFRGECQ